MALVFGGCFLSKEDQEVTYERISMGKYLKKKKTSPLQKFLGLGLLVAAAVLGAFQLNRLQPSEERVWSPADFYWQEGFLRSDAGEVVTGIDVSSHQQEIDWQQVRQAGIEFVFVRLGYRGYETGVLTEDARALENLDGARAAGLSVGAYVFSQALDTAEAEEEAAFALNILAGRQLDLPLVFDWEYVSKEARTGGMDRRTLTDCTLAFCRKAEEAGYEPMVYFNGSQARDLLYLEELSGYRFWLAQYDHTLPFPCPADFWQYTDSGEVPGISGKVDLNLIFPA